jgi:FkbM family methyltransferase
MDNLQNLMHISYEKDDNKINIFYSGYDPIDYKVSFKCLTSGAPMYWMNFKADSPLGWFVIPIPQHIMKFHQLATFRGFSLDFYNQNDELKYSHEIVVNDIFPRLPKVNFEPFDCSFRNYIEFFSDDIYGSFNLNDMDTVIDVGANIGLFAKYMYAKDAKKVILVEANPLLDKNIKTVLGSDYENSPVYLAPLTGKKQNIKFHYSTKNSTIGTHTFDNSNPSYSDLDSTMDLETITFDEIVKDNNLTNISLFKCDIEGGEYELIESLTDEHMNMIEKFIIEFHGNNNGELIPMVDKLTKFGFECELFTLHMTRKDRVSINEPHGVLITKRKK